MRIEREQHSLNGGLSRLFIIDVTSIVLFDQLDRFAVVGFNFISLVFIFRDAACL